MQCKMCLPHLKGTRRMKVDSVPDTASHRWSQVVPRA